MSDARRYVDWERHEHAANACSACGEGFPRPCPCGALVHREMMALPGGGHVQMTRCSRCHLPEGR